jgi:hypothetical protein
MAKIDKGILGALSGKLGPIVGSTWKDVAYIRMANQSTAPRAVSPAQLAHHQKFKFVTKWLRPLHSYLNIGFKNLAKNTTEINAAFSFHFKNALKGDPPNFYMDYQAVQIGLGDLKGLHQPGINFLTANSVQLNWQNENGLNSQYDDQLMLLLYNDETGIADGFIGGIKRAAKTCTFIFEHELTGLPLHVYVGMYELNGSKISNSQYLGKIEPI